VACAHFSLFAGFVIAIVVELIQRFSCLKNYPFSFSANLAAHSLSKVFLPSLALLQPMKQTRSVFTDYGVQISDVSTDQGVTDVI